MYRYKFDPKTNDATEIAIFKKVQPSAAFMENIVNERIVRGTPRVFFKKRYSMVELIGKNNTRLGYKLIPESSNNPPEYFKYEKNEVL